MIENDILHCKENKADVSVNHDLAICIMNLQAIEEHLFFTGAKTGETEYYDMITSVREMRKELLKKIVNPKPNGEIWCTSKHLLNASMRMMEVGTKEQTLGNNQEAYSCFERSYGLYMMFWKLNLPDENEVGEQNLQQNAVQKETQKETIASFTEKMNNIKSFINNTDNSIEKKQQPVQKSANGVKDQKSKFNFSNLKKFISEKLDCCRE